MTTRRLQPGRSVAMRRAATNRRERGGRSGAGWLKLVALLGLALVAGIALALSIQPALATASSYLDALPRPEIHPTNLLYNPRPAPPVDAILLLLAPAGVAALAGLLSVFGPPYRRVILALLGLLVAAYNLFTTLAYLWEFVWSESGAGVISLGVYLALSASLALIALDFGLLHLALARAWTWPALKGRHALGVARVWVILTGVGGATALVSIFLVWGYWRPGQRVTGEAVSPLSMLTSGSPASRTLASAALLALPVCAPLCAWLWSRAPRWGRTPLAALALLAGATSLGLGLLTLARLYLHARGASILTSGAGVGLGSAALLLIALFGLLSTPLPTPAPFLAPARARKTAAPATKPIAAPATRPVTAPVSAPVLLPAPAPEPARHRAPTTRRLTEAEPVSAP